MFLKIRNLLFLQGPIILLGFLSTVIITRIYGVAGYGQVALVIAISNIFAAVIRYGFDETLIILLNNSDNQRALFYSSILVRCCLYLLAIVSLYVGNVFGLLDALQVLAICSFLLVILQVPAIYDFLGKQEKHVVTLIISKLIFLMMVLSLSSMYFDVLFVFTIASLMSNIGLLSLQLRFYLNERPFASPLSSAQSNVNYMSRALLRGNFFVMLASVLSLGMYSVNQILIKDSLSFEVLGVFAIQWQVINILLIFMKQVTRAFKPRLAEIKATASKSFQKLYFTYALTVVLIPCALSLGIWVVYADIFGLIFGPQLIGYRGIYLLLCGFLVLKGIQLSLAQLAYLQKENGVVFISNAASLITLVSCFLYLGSYDSLEQAIVVMGAAMTVSILVFLVIVKKSNNRAV
jgi:O-antigen/teichoic acid export membrane protein